MNETLTTLRGRIVTDPSSRRVGDDTVMSFRVACNSTYLDRATQEWRTSCTLYLQASCWGHLGQQVGGRLFKGDAVILHGRLQSTEYERDGVPTRDTEMRVYAIGPDMSKMDVTVRRPARSEPPAGGTPADDDEAGAPTDVTGLEEAPEGELVGAGTAAGPRDESGVPF